MEFPSPIPRPTAPPPPYLFKCQIETFAGHCNEDRNDIVKKTLSPVTVLFYAFRVFVNNDKLRFLLLLLGFCLK